MSRLLLTLIDGFALYAGQQPISVPTEKARALLVYLAATPTSSTRARLAALLWPALSPAAAAANLSQTLWVIRRAVTAYGIDPLISDPLQIRLNRPLIGCDTDAGDQALARVQAHDHRSITSCAACLQLLRTTLTVQRRDFAAGVELTDAAGFNDWLTIEREQRRSRRLAVLQALAAAAERQHDYLQATRDREQAVQLDPLNEALQRDLLRVLALQGRRAAALRRLQQFSGLLNEELGLTPEPATLQLAAAIRLGTLHAQPLPPLICPAPPTPFIGRDDELQHLHLLLGRRDVRLVTITGIGGIGKTALALSAAPAYRTLFADGVCFVPLVDADSREGAVNAVINRLELRLSGSEAADPESALMARLQQRQLLLILDNAEQVPDLRLLVSRLLRRAAGLQLLVTSRRRLQITHEHVFALHGLNAADTAAAALPPAQQLFHAAARSAAPAAALDAAAVSTVCRLLGGSPLGIRLAVHQLRRLRITELSELLHRRIDLPQVAGNDLPVRHQQILTLITHCWHELNDDGRAALFALSLFHGGFRAEAAAALLGGGRHAAAVLHDLDDRGLLPPQSASRSELHPLLRGFARSVVTADVSDTFHRRFTDYFLTLLADAGLQVVGRANRRRADALLEEYDNLATAWQAAIDSGRTAELAALAEPLTMLTLLNGRYREGLQLLSSTAAHAAPADAAELHLAVTRIAIQQNDLERAEQHAQAALTSSTALSVRLQADRILAQLAMDRGRPDQADQLFQRALSQAAALPDRHAARLLYNAGRFYSHQGRLDQAEPLLLQARDLARRAGDGTTEVSAVDYLAQLPARRGDLAASLPLFEAALSLARELGDYLATITALTHLASLRMLCGRPPEQYADLFDEALRLARRHLQDSAQLDLLHSSGCSAVLRGDYPRAAALLGEGLQIAQRSGMRQMLLEMIEGFGLLAAHSGRSTLAVRCLSIAVQRPETMAMTRSRAAERLAELPAQPPAPADDAALAALIRELSSAAAFDVAGRESGL